MKRRTFASGFLSGTDVDEDDEDEDEDEDRDGNAGVSLEIFLSKIVFAFPDSLIAGSIWKSLIFPCAKLDNEFSFFLGTGTGGKSSSGTSSYSL